MNLYLRYFDSEILVTDVNSAIEFLANIEEVGMNDKIAGDVRAYFESDNKYPKRYKVRPKIYFIMIKTDASTMQEFKEYRQNSVSKANEEQASVLEEQTADAQTEHQMPAYEEPEVPFENRFMSRRERNINMQLLALQTQRFGWYEGTFDFKRVVTIPSTGKNEYRDTHFVACCKAMSGMDCYNRIVDHLRDRVDSRSQFPSAKGKNFSFTFLGQCKYIEESQNE